MKHIFQLTTKLLTCILFVIWIFHPLIALSNCNQIQNSSFGNGHQDWIAAVNHEHGAVGNVTFTKQNASFQIDGVGEENWCVSLEQRGVKIQKGESYQIRFRAKAETNRPITVSVSDIGGSYLTLSKSNRHINITTDWVIYEYTFNANITDYTARLVFMLGAQTGDVFIDDVTMEKWNCCLPVGTPCNDNDACTINDVEDGNCNCLGELTSNNQVINGDFSGNFYDAWRRTIHTKDGAIAGLVFDQGEAHFEIEQAGQKNWNIALEQRTLSIEANQHYKINFKAKASEARNINVKISDVGNGFQTYFSQDVALTNSWQQYTFEYMAETTDTEVRLIFNMGLETPDVTIDDVSFEAFNCATCEAYREFCDDGDPCTINDYYDASCNCVSYTLKDQIITNGNFSDQLAGWQYTILGDSGAEANADFDDRMAHFKIENDGTRDWHISLEQRGIPFIEGENYTIKFRVLANTERSINFKISDDEGDFKTYFDDDLHLRNFWMNYSRTFTPEFTDYSTRIIFNMGIDAMQNERSEIFIDDVSITKSDCLNDVPVKTADYFALQRFYEENCNTGCELDWNLSQPVHTWEGVEIENENVIALNVASKGLSGDIANLNLPALTILDLSNNNFNEISANFSTLEHLHYLDISKNQLSFEAVEKNFDAHSNLDQFIYSPQYTGYEESYVWQKGNTYTLELPEELSYLTNHTSLQWKRNNELISGANTASHFIQQLNQSAIGIYTLHISNESLVPDMEIVLRPINVFMGGYDIHGQPIYNNEVMVLFDDVTERDAFFTKYLNQPYNGKVSFQCDCNRLLYLIRFERIRGEPDGDPNTFIQLEHKPSDLQMWKWPQVQQQSSGELVSVYILDSGLDISNLKNTEYLINEAPLNGCYELKTFGYSFVTNQSKISTNYMDNIGHGTYGYNAIIGENEYLNNLKVVPVKIFNDKGEGSLFHFVCGLFHSIDNNANIINVSGGYRNVNSSILETAFQIAQQKGIFIVTSAGNDATDIDLYPQYPAYYAGQSYQKERLDEYGNHILDADGKPVFDEVPYDNIIAVASLNNEDELSEFSNYGANSVTLSAYGENLVANALNGQSAIYSGTSMAAFYTTRELANELIKDKNRSYKQVWQDFEANYLVLNTSMADKTITGKQINVALEQVHLKNSITETKEQLTVFPNPSAGKVNIKSTCFDYSDDIVISIYNILGEEVFKQNTKCIPLIQIQADTLNKGTYFIKLSAAREIMHGKLIIN